MQGWRMKNRAALKTQSQSRRDACGGGVYVVAGGGQTTAGWCERVRGEAFDSAAQCDDAERHLALLWGLRLERSAQACSDA